MGALQRAGEIHRPGYFRIESTPCPQDHEVRAQQITGRIPADRYGMAADGASTAGDLPRGDVSAS
ncbi:MAG TPA: hypothetical protein VHQ45_06905 [Gemmatimonadaceae bacterium]|jgi:hypothetical protein|nr:hypothetical protein [Gemmatimonadaceae bacterium]